MLVTTGEVNGERVVGPTVTLPLKLVQEPVVRGVDPGGRGFPVGANGVDIGGELLSFGRFVVCPSGRGGVGSVEAGADPTIPVQLFYV